MTKAKRWERCVSCKVLCKLSCIVLRGRTNRGGEGRAAKGEGDDQSTGGAPGSGAERGREEWERGCLAQCSAPCAHGQRGLEEEQGQNTGEARGQPEERRREQVPRKLLCTVRAQIEGARAQKKAGDSGSEAWPKRAYRTHQGHRGPTKGEGHGVGRVRENSKRKGAREGTRNGR